VANVLGLIGFLLFILAVVGAAAGITWAVVRLSPPKAQQPPPSS